MRKQNQIDWLRRARREAMTLQHVSLEVRRADVPGELRFWELLGFDARSSRPGTLGGDRASWVQRGATQIHLLFADDPVVPPQGHAAVVVDDFDATVAALVEAGLTPKERTRHWGAAARVRPQPGGSHRRADGRAAPSMTGPAVPSYSRPHPWPALTRRSIMHVWPPPPSPAPLSSSPPPSSPAATPISASATSFAPA